jgi:hypothetical protein
VALAEDASSPSVVTGAGGGNPIVATTGSFTPPSGALLVAIAMGGRSSGSLQIAGTITSSPSLTWLVAAYAQGAGADNGGTVLIAYSYLVSAPGAMTVSVSLTNVAAGRVLVVKAITGAAASQVSAGTATKVQATNSTVGTVDVTTTAPNSLVYGGSVCQVSNTALTLNGTTSLVNDYNNSTGTTRHIAWKAAGLTGTPGVTTLGGTWATSTKFAIAAFEVLAAIPPPVPDRKLIIQQAVRRSYSY